MRRLAPLALALALLPACDEPVTYSYFQIHVHLDATVGLELLDRVQACAVVAQTPVREDSADLGCRRHMTTGDLGTFEYTTALTSGAVKFLLVVNDFNGDPIARGETAPIQIQVGKTATGELVGTLAPGAKPPTEPEPDAGAPAPDAGASD
jgi:hypothetical protein